MSHDIWISWSFGNQRSGERVLARRILATYSLGSEPWEFMLYFLSEPNEAGLEQIQDLDPKLLSLLGKMETVPEVGPEIHVNVLEIWKKILLSGFDQNQETISKYKGVGKWAWLMAPNLNPEIKTILPEPAIQRDSRLAEVQQAVGASLIALGGAITKLLKADKDQSELIGTLSDAARLLCGVHNQLHAVR